MSRLESMIAKHLLTGSLPETTGEVSARFLRGARQALDRFRLWGLDTDVDLSTFTPVVHTDGGNRVACFFTLGVDSLYTLITHLDEIDDVIYVENFEVRLQPDVRQYTLEQIKAVAEQFGKNAVFARSDARRILNPVGSWLIFGHGPALASVGLSYEHVYRKIYIASSNEAAIIPPSATHPEIDPLWSTETLEFVHDAMLTRIDKLREIGKHQDLLDKLRVCWQGHTYNCGECEKCVRTKVSLHLLGLESAALPGVPTLKRINELGREHYGGLPATWDQNLAEAVRIGADPDLIAALSGQL